MISKFIPGPRMMVQWPNPHFTSTRIPYGSQILTQLPNFESKSLLMAEESSRGHPIAWARCTPTGDVIKVPGFQMGSTPCVAGVWGVNQQMEDRCLCRSPL